MKKRLEAELISIAHRILKLRNKSEVDQLYLESKKLYETLAVLKFYGDNYEVVKNDVAVEDLEAKLDAALDAPEVVAVAAPVVEEAPVVVDEKVETEEMEEVEVETEAETEVVEEEVETEAVEEVVAEEETEAVTEEETIEEEPVIVGEITLDEEDEEEEVPMTEAKSDLDFEPIFELAAEPMVEEEETVEVAPEVAPIVVEEPAVETPKKDEPKQISLADLLGENYSEPVFVKPDDVVVPPSLKNVIDEQGKSLNEMHSKTINIGLNDKIAFVKYLFADSTEDYNRVLSQLNTFSTFAEAKDFIDEIIKPDYNNWDGVDDYAERFIAIVAKKFS